MATIETIYRMSEGHSYDISQSRGGSRFMAALTWLELSAREAALAAGRCSK